MTTEELERMAEEAVAEEGLIDPEKQPAAACLEVSDR